MNPLTKSLITVFSGLLLAVNLNAKTTICYKNNWENPSTIETTKLDGGECKSSYSFKQMQKNGWFLKDIKIKKGEKGLNYSYIFTDQELVSIDNTNFLKNEYAKLQFTPIKTYIKEVLNDEVIIDIPNLRPGQSAIIKHNYSNGKSIIVSNAYVTKSSENNSTLKLIPFMDIKQNAMPTTNRDVVKDDTVIINYLYNASLIIAPSQDAFTQTRKKYADINFLHSDIFAAKLKVEQEPLPSKKTIQDFAISQNIGTLFFILGSKLYVVDSKTFTIIDEDTISYNFVQEDKMPFYTRVEKIEKSVLNSILDIAEWSTLIKNLIGDDKRSEEEVLLEDKIESGSLEIKAEIYNSYYKTLLGLK